MFKRKLGRSSIEVSALGFGTARIGGLGWQKGSNPVADNNQFEVEESIRAIQMALDMGVTFFDTADAYGYGHSERILGQALADSRDKVIIATKFGILFQGENSQNARITPEQIKLACENSLKRLKTDYVDLYLFHIHDYDLGCAGEVRDVLEYLIGEGKIRFYGWSTDDVERAHFFAQGTHCVAIEHNLNILNDNPAMLKLCEEYDLASINRVPLLRGVLAGRWIPETKLPEEDRRSDWFCEKDFLELLGQVHAMRRVLTNDGRTCAQGALGWIWARSERTIPIPGFRTTGQVEECVKAMSFDPFNCRQMNEIDRLLNNK